MNHDDSLRAKARQNTLRAFLRYEQRLKLAYARSQNPQPKRWYGTNNSRGSQGMGD